LSQPRYFWCEIRQQDDLYGEVPERLVTLTTAVLFVILEGLLIILYIGTGTAVDFLDIIHLAVIIIAFITVVAKFFLVAGEESNSTIKGWLSIVLFQFVGLIEQQAQGIGLRSSAIFIAFGIFALLFAASYYQAKQRF